MEGEPMRLWKTQQIDVEDSSHREEQQRQVVAVHLMQLQPQ